MPLIITYEKLKKILTEEEGFSYILQLAKTFKFPATSFLSGSIGYTILKIQGSILAILSDSVAQISKQIYLDTSTDDFLSLLADNFFDETRYPETQTVIQPKISHVGAIPNLYSAESVKIRIGEIEFYNIDMFVIPAIDGYVNPKFASTEYGADTRVQTNLVPIFTDNVIANATFDLINNEDGYFIVISNGQNIESDEDLKERCRAKWATLGSHGPEDSYFYWIKSTINPNTQQPVDIKRIKIDRSEAQTIGMVNIYCASEIKTASDEDVTAANIEIQKYRAINSVISCSKAIEKTFNYYLKITANSTSEQNDELLRESVKKCIQDYFSAIDIGGIVLTAGALGKVIYSRIVDLVMELPGIENVEFVTLTVSDDSSSPYNTAADITINPFEIPVISADTFSQIVRI